MLAGSSLTRSRGHVWTAPALQEESGCGLRSGASHVSGLLSRRMTAGPDVIRGSGPDQNFGLLRPIDPSRDFPIDGSTVRITPSSPSQLERVCRREFYFFIAKPLKQVPRAPARDRFLPWPAPPRRCGPSCWRAPPPPPLPAAEPAAA